MQKKYWNCDRREYCYLLWKTCLQYEKYFSKVILHGSYVLDPLSVLVWYNSHNETKLELFILGTKMKLTSVFAVWCFRQALHVSVNEGSR